MKVEDRDIKKDLTLLAKAFFENLRADDGCEFGTIGLDCKRPFGNSAADEDILEIIEWDMEGDDGNGPCYASYQKDYAYDLYFEKLIPFLQQKAKTIKW